MEGVGRDSQNPLVVALWFSLMEELQLPAAQSTLCSASWGAARVASAKATQPNPTQSDRSGWIRKACSIPTPVSKSALQNLKLTWALYI